MTEEQPDYLAYLLRLWRVSEQGKAVWRASLQNSLNGDLLGFASLDDMFLFLRRQTDAMANDDENDDGH
jgi:hypothetical protein